jgi:hypothetical protein
MDGRGHISGSVMPATDSQHSTAGVGIVNPAHTMSCPTRPSTRRAKTDARDGRR